MFTQNQNTAPAPQALAEDSASVSDSESNSMDDTLELKACFFNDLEAGQEAANTALEAAEKENLNPVFNFEPEAGIKDGYGLAVIPLTERRKNMGTIVNGLCIAAIPTFELLLETPAGENWLKDLCARELMRKVKVSAQPKSDGSHITSLPFSVLDFISSTRDSGLAAFNKFASDYVKVLKSKYGMQFMSKILLRQVLASAEFAEQQFPRVKQDSWEILLKSMIAHSEKVSLKPGDLVHWLNTRHETIIELADVDLSNLDDLI